MLKKISFKIRIFLSIIVYFLVVHGLISLDFLFNKKHYLDPTYQNVYSKIMMPHFGPPPLEFLFTSNIVSIFLAVIFVGGYLVVRKSFKQDSSLAQGALYGLFVFCVGSLPALAMLFLFINISLGLLASWILESSVAMIIAGAAVGWLLAHPKPFEIK